MRIALVGDRSPGVRAHARVPPLLEALRERDGIALDAYWIPTTEARDLDAFDGVWVVPGSPYLSERGAVEAARTAREHGIPFLGTCGGFQHMLLEYARGVCGLDVAHAENEPEAGDGGRDFLLMPLRCSLAGHEGMVRLAPGSLIEQIMGAPVTVEAYSCSYGLNEHYERVLIEHGLVFSGHAEDDGMVRVAELPGHPFFLGTLFQPELAGDGSRPHPVISAFAAAVVARSSGVTLGS
ncbi:hypothetical protein JYK22_23640 [Nonomuraea sp. RK-328]|nr:hypothetical protein [Nonomuraea sp. RK-328]